MASPVLAACGSVAARHRSLSRTGYEVLCHIHEQDSPNRCFCVFKPLR